MQQSHSSVYSLVGYSNKTMLLIQPYRDSHFKMQILAFIYLHSFTLACISRFYDVWNISHLSLVLWQLLLMLVITINLLQGVMTFICVKTHTWTTSFGR